MAAEWSANDDSHNSCILGAEMLDDVVEIAFSYETLHHYIEPTTEAPAEHKQLEYGFAWLAPHHRFFAVETCPPDVVRHLRRCLTASGIRSMSLSFDQQALDDLVAVENIHSFGIRALATATDEPISQRFSDPHMDHKQEFVRRKRQQGEQTQGLYSHTFDDGSTTRLRLSNRLGKVGLARRLKTSELRVNGSQLIARIVAAMHSLLTSDIEQFANLTTIERAWCGRVKEPARSLLKIVALAVHRAKNSNSDAVSLGRVTARQIMDATPAKWWVANVVDYCEVCAMDQPLYCDRCEQAIRPDMARGGYGCGCRSGVGPAQLSAACLEGHQVRADACELELLPTPSVVELVVIASRELIGLEVNRDSDAFLIRGSRLLYGTVGAYQTSYLPSEVIEFRSVLEERVANTAAAYREVHQLREKCRVARSCVDCGMSFAEGACLMNVMRLAVGAQPRPHHGHEFGDAMLEVTIRGHRQTARILAKRGRVKSVAPGSDEGRGLVTQTAMACMDARTDVVVVVLPAPLDDQLRSLLVELCRQKGRKLVILGEEFIARAVQRARRMEPGGRQQ